MCIRDRFDTAAHLDGLAANAAVGVNWNILTIAGGESTAQMFEAVDRYGERIIRVSGSPA